MMLLVLKYKFNLGIIFSYSLIGVHIITKSILEIFFFKLVNILQEIFNFFILEIFFFDFSYTNIFFDNFLFDTALKTEEPIKPHPIINNLLNIFNN